MWILREHSTSLWFKLAIIVAVTLGLAQLVSASPPLLTPPHCDGTGCASAKPTGFVIKLPWDDSTTHTIIQGYGSGLHQGVCRATAVNDYHALDFDLVTGNSVRAIADGQVVYAGWATGGWSSYGQIVIIDHQNGYQSLYAHLNGLDVSDNQWVQQEQKIGEAGGSGGWDPHLHFSLYHNASIADPGGPYGGCATVPEYFRGVQDYEDLVQDMDLTSEGGGPPPPDHSVQFYIDAHYGGGGYCYGDSEGNYNNLGGCPGYNDQISSVLLKSGWSVRVFKHENLGEPSRCFTSSDDDFANDTFDDGSQLNDQMSSFALYHQSNCPPPVTPPTADFDAWPQSGNAPLTVAFHNISSGDYTSCYWEYGDGNTGNSCDDYHDYTYDNPGTYTVRLTVNGPGGSDTRTRSNYITVNALPPTADFDAWPQSGNAPLTVAFHNISSGDYTSCYWEYGDGNTGNSCDGYHDYTYDNPGTYTVRLTVNGPGGSDTRTRYGYITVNVPPPTADFDASPLSGDGPLTVAFHNASSGSYTSCYWEYGDGSTSDWPYGYHFHTYASPGSYTVRLTVIGPGGSDTRTRYDYITVNPVDTEKPVVNWIAPVGDGEVYPVGDEVIQLEVNATDNVAVARVRFYRWDAVNEQWVEIGNDYSAPYQMNLDCSTLNEGWNEIDAEAYDTAGNSSDRKHIWLDRSTPRPDLHPYAPAGYSYPVVPSSVSGTHEVNTLYAGQTTYFDWHFVNSGNATASGNFHVELWVGDTRYVRYPYSDYGAGQSSGFDDWMETIPTPGWHTVRLITDPDNSVDESDENNNVWEGQFYWEPSGPLVYSAHTVDDDNTGESNGNGDGIVNCGETIELYVDLYNQGGSTATGVNATISTSDPYVTWLYNTDSSYPDIPDGGTGTNSNDFDFQVDLSTPDGHVIHFDLDINASNGGPWSDSFDVPVVCLNNPPNTPSNPSPTDGATNRDINVDLSWTGGDPDPGDTVTYDVYFEANDSTPDNLICDDASTPACDPGTLAYDTHYYWYVVATDNHGASTTGDTWDFHTGAAPNNPPHQPGNSMPADGATSVSITADLSWTGGDPDPGDTVTYDVYFEANDSTPDNLICDDASTPACDPGTLAYDTHYYWYVVATDNHGASTTGDTWDFTTQSAPPTVGPLVYDSHTIDDDNSGQSSGNGNGIVNCGETIELYVDLYNQGSSTATGVNAAISTSDPYVTSWLYNTESTYPDIPGGGTSTNSNDFDFQVDPSTPDGHVIHFDLDINASNGGPWSDSFDVPVACECYNLNTSVNPIGSGNITASPPPNCGGGQYTAGAQVQLTANPASGYNFSHWSGDASSSANPITVTMDGNKLVTASFTQPCYSLSTSVSPSGSVSVDPSPNCGSDQYTAGTQVQLTANPPPGYNFSHWSGDASGSANPTTVTMDGDKSVTANFIAAEPPEEFKIYLPTVARHYPGMIQVRFALRNR